MHGWNGRRGVPSRARTVVPTIAACVLALGVALAGLHADAVAGPDAAESQPPAAATAPGPGTPCPELGVPGVAGPAPVVPVQHTG